MDNSTFDPYAQAIVLLAPDGRTPFAFTLANQGAIQELATTQGIIYGVQIGMTALLLLVLLVLTKREKRRRIIFTLNAFALLLAVCRNVLSAWETTSIFYHYYNWQFEYYPDDAVLHRAQAVSLTAEIINVLLDMIVYASMVLQVQVVCCTMRRSYKVLILTASSFAAVVTCIFRILLAVINIKYSILGIETYTPQQISLISLLASINNILSVTSISIFSIIFSTKLLFAILARRRLGISQFGPMQIIFIMGCQTLVFPLFFAILTYYVLPDHQLNSFAITMVAIFLPLSGMWASASSNDLKDEADHMHHRLIPSDVRKQVPMDKVDGCMSDCVSETLVENSPKLVDVFQTDQHKIMVIGGSSPASPA